MNRPPPIARWFPNTYRQHHLLYNLLVILISLGIGVLSFVTLSFLSLLGSFLLAEHFRAGMAGMSILLIFQAMAALGGLGIFLFFLIWNIRRF
ncbi:MAG: hypothetical protein N2442_09055 [Spirochaetes bacterium]|nr:hypothetical protein [Spirochaetota bacterium]